MSELKDLYRNAIDLNRYSNSVARRLIRAYNDVVLDAVDQLRGIDELAVPVKAARLRAIIAQLNDSLATWSRGSLETLTEELQGLAVLQSEFAEEQLRKALPTGLADRVNTVEISPSFAQAIVSTEPTVVGIVNLSDNFDLISRAPVTFQLTVGQQISLPNGEIVRDALRNMSSRQSEIFSMTVRTGLIEGESTNAIVRQLKGRLTKEQRGSIDTLIAAGGQITSVPNNQLRTLVRTTVNQVASATSEIIAAENPDATEKYLYTAVLDSRTTPICRALDGKVFSHGKGPLPPQHFNCRSRKVNIPIGLEQQFRDLRDDYGVWLNGQSEKEKEKVLGPGRLKYWNGLVKKYGASDAIRKYVSKDGSELTLQEIKARYSKLRSA